MIGNLEIEILQYSALVVMIISATIPVLLFNFFLHGGELFIYLSSRFAKFHMILDYYTPRLSFAVLVWSCFVLDWTLCLSFFFSSLIFTFVFMAVLSGATQGASSFVIRRFIPVIQIFAIIATVFLGLTYLY